MARFSLLPKGTNFYEIVQLPYYNYLAQTTRRDDLIALRYSYGQHKRQYILFCTPKEGEIRDEVIVYFHGGGWTFGSPEMFRSNAQFFIDQGYVVVMPSYRRLPKYRAPDLAADARAALQKTMEVLSAKQWPYKSLLIGGMSSGAHLAALLAYDRSHWPALPFRQAQLAGIFLFGPPLDLTQMAWSPVVWRLAGAKTSEHFVAANPINYVEDGEETPTLIIHGTSDGLVNYKSTISFLRKRGNKNLQLHRIERGSHLDAAYWVFRENEERRVILDWLAARAQKK